MQIYAHSLSYWKLDKNIDTVPMAMWLARSLSPAWQSHDTLTLTNLTPNLTNQTNKEKEKGAGHDFATQRGSHEYAGTSWLA